MDNSFKIDLSEYAEATNKLMRMDTIYKKSIDRIFKDANQALVRSAKTGSPKSKFGSYSLKYPSRTHKAGALKSGMVFRISKKYQLTYYMLSKAWYSQIYIGGTKFFPRHPVIERAYAGAQRQMTKNIKDHLGALINKVWRNG